MVNHEAVIPDNVGIFPTTAGVVPVATSTSRLEEMTSNGQHVNSGDALLWPAQNPHPPSNNTLQPDLSSSLLWPDSENLFLSLTDGGLWDQSMPGLISLEHLPQGGPQAMAAPPVVVGLSPYDEPTVTEDGRRAVQTTNGLLTNTVGVPWTTPKVRAAQ